MTIRDVVSILVPLAFTVYGFMRWRENGYWMPHFVHVAAIFALLVGFGLVWMSYSSDAPNKFKMWSIVIVMPLLVYWAFMIYGGGAGVRKFNDKLLMHASMNEGDVLHMLRTHFAPYRNRDYLELKKLIGEPDLVALNSPSGKRYEMRVQSQTDRDDSRADVHVYCLLGEMGRKRGVPVASTMFSKQATGVIVSDGLNMPFRSKWRR